MDMLETHKIMPPVPENPLFMQFIGVTGPIDEHLVSAMPFTKWQNNGAAFEDEEGSD